MSPPNGVRRILILSLLILIKTLIHTHTNFNDIKHFSVMETNRNIWRQSCVVIFRWFYSNLSRAKAEEYLLRIPRDGAFLIRQKKEPDTFVLSIRFLSFFHFSFSYCSHRQFPLCMYLYLPICYTELKGLLSIIWYTDTTASMCCQTSTSFLGLKTWSSVSVSSFSTTR